VEYLIPALKDEDKDVRRVAASALGKIGGPAAVVLLVQSLKDESEWFATERSNRWGKWGT